MEKKILLLILYVAVLLLIKHENLMKIQENRGFYIDIIDPMQDELLESSLCLKEEDFTDQNVITS